MTQYSLYNARKSRVRTRLPKHPLKWLKKQVCQRIAANSIQGVKYVIFSPENSDTVAHCSDSSFWSMRRHLSLTEYLCERALACRGIDHFAVDLETGCMHLSDGKTIQMKEWFPHYQAIRDIRRFS